MADDNDRGFLGLIRELHSRDPFEPFVVVMSSGECYTIHLPQNFVFAKTELVYYDAGTDHFIFMRLNQISSVEKYAPPKSKKRRKSA